MPYCQNCGNEVQSGTRFCPECGANIQQDQYRQSHADQSYYQQPYSKKDPTIATILAVVLGFFGLFGIGHIYVGRIARGIVLLILGLIIVPLFVFGAIFNFALFGSGGLGGGIVLIIFSAVIWFILLIWQTFDAYSLAKEYNREVQMTGKEPW